jgi:hypothetical protein
MVRACGARASLRHDLTRGPGWGYTAPGETGKVVWALFLLLYSGPMAAALLPADGRHRLTGRSAVLQHLLQYCGVPGSVRLTCTITLTGAGRSGRAASAGTVLAGPGIVAPGGKR